MPRDGAANPKTSRRLAAILAADITGYSTLMGADEALTVRDLKDHLAVVRWSPTRRSSDRHRCDGIPAEFGSVVNAPRRHARAARTGWRTQSRLQPSN